MKTTIAASQVRVGDTVEVWWRPNRDTVTAIEPYKGPLECMQGGWIFKFALLAVKDGMSVAPGDMFELVK